MPDTNPTPESTLVNITDKTSRISSAQNNIFFLFMDALSLSGAIIAMFFSITVYGIVQGNEKVWQTGMTALTTFVSGKKLGQYEANKE